MPLVSTDDFQIDKHHSFQSSKRRLGQLQAHQLYLDSWETDRTNASGNHFQIY